MLMVFKWYHLIKWYLRFFWIFGFFGCYPSNSGIFPRSDHQLSMHKTPLTRIRFIAQLTRKTFLLFSKHAYRLSKKKLIFKQFFFLLRVLKRWRFQPHTRFIVRFQWQQTGCVLHTENSIGWKFSNVSFASNLSSNHGSAMSGRRDDARIILSNRKFPYTRPVPEV